MTPLEAAKEALSAWDRNIPHEIVQDLHWSDIADPWQAASFVQGYITALTESEEKAKRNEAKLADVKCQLLDMLDLMPVPGSRWRMNIKAALRTIDAALAGGPK